MCMRERLGGEWRGTLNLVVCGVDGVLLSLLVRLEWGYGRILRGVGGIFCITSDLRWKIAQRLDSGMISGVRMWPLRKPFQTYLVLPTQMMPLSQPTWSFFGGSNQWNVSFARAAHD